MAPVLGLRATTAPSRPASSVAANFWKLDSTVICRLSGDGWVGKELLNCSIFVGSVIGVSGPLSKRSCTGSRARPCHK